MADNVVQVAAIKVASELLSYPSTYPTPPSKLAPGRTLLIMGKCSAGPIQKPLYLKTPAQVFEYFGPELVRPYVEAQNAGARDIFVMRIRPAKSKNELYAALEDAYESIFGWPFDLILPVDACFDDSAALADKSTDHLTFMDHTGAGMNFAWQLAYFCYRKMDLGEYSHGIIGMRAISEASSTWVDKVVSYALPTDADGNYLNTGKPIEYSDGGMNDLGRMVSVVAAWPTYEYDSETSYTASGAATYAGLLASLPPQENPTYKPLNLSNLSVEFSDDQNKKLAQAGVVTFKTTVRHGIAPYEAVSYALPSSDFHSLPNLRISNEACLRVQQAIDIGTSSFRVSPADRAKTVLQQMVKEGSIRNYSVEEIYAGLTAVELHLTIVPYTHVTSLNISIRVNQ